MWLDTAYADGTALTVTTQENAIEKTFDKMFPIALDFEFFEHPVYPFGLKEDFSKAYDVVLVVDPGFL